MKLKARYENGVLIPEKRIFPKQPNLTIEVADEDMNPEGMVAEPVAVSKPEWTEKELELFRYFPGLKKAREILREPPPEIFEEEGLTERQQAMCEAMELREEIRRSRGRSD